jgi:hypothetical protein
VENVMIPPRPNGALIWQALRRDVLGPTLSLEAASESPTVDQVPLAALRAVAFVGAAPSLPAVIA